MSAKDRFDKFVSIDQKTGCWNWMGAKDNHGYGRFGLNGRVVSSHRTNYEFYRGKIPDGLTIDHLCRNRACVNPDHLEAVTMKENGLRGNSICAVYARRTHCKQGHKFTPENTFVSKNQRRCRECDRIKKRKKYARKKFESTKNYPAPMAAGSRHSSP